MSDEITSFREANFAALYNTGHADHTRAVAGLTELYEVRYPTGGAITPAEPQPSAPARHLPPVFREQKPADPAALQAIEDFRKECGAALDNPSHRGHASAVQTLQALTEAAYPEDDEPEDIPGPRRVDERDMAAMLAPAPSPETYTFRGLAEAPQFVAVETPDGIEHLAVEASPEFEQEARQTFHEMGATPAQAQALERAYVASMRDGFSEENSSRMYEDTRRDLINEYGEKWQDVLGAANAVYATMPERIRTMLSMSGLANHPQIVGAFINKAKQKGLFK